MPVTEAEKADAPLSRPIALSSERSERVEGRVVLAVPRNGRSAERAPAPFDRLRTVFDHSLAALGLAQGKRGDVRVEITEDAE